jgi:putative nucleotidyltransferase with HDIG domain
MPRVLLVDDDDFFRKAIREILEAHKFSVVEAPNGKIAKDVLAAGKFEIIISDIQMPYLTGLELLEWVRTHKPEVPLVLVTGFGLLVETKSAADLGAAGFIAKPFKDTDVLEITNSVLKLNKNEKPINVNLDEQYCRVSIEDFVMGKQIPFAVSIRLSATKYIKVAHKGENIDIEKIKGYKNKGITHLFVKKEDYAQLVGFNLKLAKAVKASNQISEEKKKAFLKYTGEVVLEQAFAVGMNEGTFRTAKDFIETSLSVVSEDEDTLSLLMLLNSHSDYQYAHALGVSTVAVMVAKAIGWDSPANIFKLGLSGMFHDIGKKEIPKEIIEKPRHLLTASERSLVETHVVRGKDILQMVRAMPDDIVKVASQHHEDCLGQGYPRRLKKNEIHPFARIIFLVDLFCNYTIRNTHSDGIPADQAISKIETFHNDEVDQELFSALKSAISNVTVKKMA